MKTRLLRALLFAGIAALLLIPSSPVFAVEEVLDRVAAIVGRDVILESEVDEYLQLHLLEAGIQPDRLSQEERDTYRCEVLRSVVDDRLLVSKARLDSIQVAPQEVEQRLREQFDTLKRRFPNEQAFQQQLAQEGTTERELRNRLRTQMERYLLRERLIGQMAGTVTVTFREIEKFYEENRDSLPTVPASVTIAHITRVAQPGDSALALAREKIERAQARIRAGESFDVVAREMSEDPGTAAAGGELGWFGRGEMVPEFETIAFSLDSGQVSSPVLTEFGLHIIQNLGFRPNEVHARHILARAQPSQHDAEAARDTMISVYERLRDGASFSELARKYSMDPTVQQTGGRVGPVSPSDLPTPFGRALSTLEVGDVSYPFESQGGTYHVVKLIDRTREHRMNMQDDRRQLEEAVRQQKLMVRLAEILDRERSRTYVDIRLPNCELTPRSVGAIAR